MQLSPRLLTEFIVMFLASQSFLILMVPFHAALSVFGSRASFACAAHLCRTKLAVFQLAVPAQSLARGTKTVLKTGAFLYPKHCLIRILAKFRTKQNNERDVTRFLT
jgi:hypothetical protein